MTNRLPRSTLIAALALALAAAAETPPAPNHGDDTIVAERGGVTLSAGDLRAALAAQTPDTRARLASDPATLANFIQSILITRVLLNQAEAAKWDQKPLVRAAIERAHDDLVVNSYLADQVKPVASYPSEADIKAAYQANLGKMMQPRRYHLEQIMITVPAGATPAADAAARRQAASLRAEAMRPKADFAALAASDSTDRSVAAAKGDMGWVPEDQLLPPIKSAVAGLPVGGISPPVETAGGWHVLKLVDTQAAGPATLAQVHAQLAQALRQQKTKQAEQNYLTKLVKQQPIQYNAIAIGAVLGNGS